MSLVKCKECGSEVSTKAKACPNCGAKVARPLLVQLFAGVIAGCILVPFLVAAIEFATYSPSAPDKPSSSAYTSKGQMTGPQKNAVRSAQSYLRSSGFSCNGLIEQLGSGYGAKYTISQASYGAQQAGAC